MIQKLNEQKKKYELIRRKFDGRSEKKKKNNE